MGLLWLLWTSASVGRAESVCPLDPNDPGWMESQTQRRESAVARQREKAIELLQSFLSVFPGATQRAEVLFRLAELQWERSEASLLDQMKRYDAALEAFRQGALKERPPEPRIDLRVSLKIYEEILERHGEFVHTDMVLYLYGFALNEQGDENAALSIYRSLIQRFPKSTFVPDAHLAVGEYHFAKSEYFAARQSYEAVLRHPDSPMYEMAAYKTAWCYFKEGQPKQAAVRFREVLNRAREKKATAKGKLQADLSDLESEALEDLALTFSESGGAKEAYRFMEQVGGEDYSIRVLSSLGKVFFRQARYPEAIESYKTLVERFPFAEENPEHQWQIGEAFERNGKPEEALQERRRLASAYGPGSPWAQKQKDRPSAMEKAFRLAEESLRYVAIRRHQQAQAKKTPESFQASAQAYSEYLTMFPETPQAPKMHYFLGEVLYQVGNFDRAAVHYGLAVERCDDPKVKKDSAYAAVLSYNRLLEKEQKRDQPPAQEESLSKAENGYVQAVERFGQIAPGDAQLPQLRFEVGRLYYLHGQFPLASQRLLAAVEASPANPFSEAAADLALDCFSRAKDWASLEDRARRFLEQKLFAKAELGKKLPGFISGAIFQNAAVLAQAGKHQNAAREYERLVAEFPEDPLAPKALLYAARSFDLAGDKSQAVGTYQRIIDRYPAQAAEAMLIIAGIYEHQYDYARAAAQYAQFTERFHDDARAPEALLQAARLASAHRDFKEEARLLTRFSQEYPNHDRAAEALLQAGLALSRAGNAQDAERTFSTYLSRHASPKEREAGGHVREATFQMGQAQLLLGKLAQAKHAFERCAAYAPKTAPTGKELEAAAHCRFVLAEMVFAEYQKIALLPPKNRLVQLLKDKAALLKKAEALFTQVVAAGNLEWASAALFRIGDMYAQFAEAIYQSPLPAGLSQKELEVYRQELQSLAYPIEEKAVSAFSISYEVAQKHHYFSQWTIKTVELLRKMDSTKFPKEEEVRPTTRWADSMVTFPLLLQKLPTPQAAPARGAP